MHIPTASTEGCDIALWKEGVEVYIMHVKHGAIYLLDGDLADFITNFPEHLNLCIMNDATGKFVKILPVAN